jgi:hypothetical protein
VYFLNLRTLKTAIEVPLLSTAGVFLAFSAYLLNMYLFVPLKIFWVNKQFEISYTDAFISILGTFILNPTLSLHLIALIFILYLAPGSLPITHGRPGIIEGGLIPTRFYLGLPLASASSFFFLERFISFGLSGIIGFFYLFYHGGFKIYHSP